MRGRMVTALGALLALALIAGCGESGDARAAPDEPTPGTGYFVGGASDGLGVAADLRGRDEVVDSLRQATGESPTVSFAVIAVVNNGPRSVPMPRFTAVLSGGGAVPLAPVDDPRLAIVGSEAVAEEPALLGPERATTIYRALPGAAPTEVAHLRMVLAPGRSLRLEQRPR